MKKPFNKYFIILVLGFILWIAETAHFGFNKEPENNVEAFLDIVSAGMMIFGIVGDLMQNIRITKSYHTVNTHNIHTKKVEVTGDNQRVIYKTTVKNVTLPDKVSE